MISDDEGSYISKYQQANNGRQSERAANEDSSDGRLLSDTNGSLGPDESIVSRKPILEQDRFLPIANISRLMKNVIPRSGKVAKDAKECVQECVSEFISFITSEACDRCLSEKRKTITGEDIIGAFASLGFDNYVDPLNAYVKKFREAFRTERGNETLMVETPGSHSGLLDKLNTHDPNESTSAEVFTIQSEPGPGSSSCASQILFTGDDDADGSLRVLSTGNVQHLQLLMDPATGQHYINVQSPNGTIQLLPVQVSAVNDSSAASVTLSSPDSLEGKPNDKNLPDFGTNNYQPSTSESGHVSSAPYKQLSSVTQLRHCTGEQSRNGASFGIDQKHDEAERLTSNPQNQQQQHQMHCNIRQFGHREQRRKRSHESVEYISLD